MGAAFPPKGKSASETTLDPEKSRTGTTVIMEQVTASGLFTAKETHEINRCRLYLQEFFLSDITDL
jgi:hypothetical protein